MVLPIPNVPMPDGPLPDECQPNVRRLKYSILAMIFFAIGRAACAVALGAVSFDFFTLLNIFLSITMGTFMLKDDEHLQRFYECLAQTICQVCADAGQGGMQCLIPFMIMTLLNVLIDFFQRMPFLSIMPYGLFLAGSELSQACAVYFACSIYQQIRVPPGGMEMGLSGGYNYDRVQRSDAPAQQGFHDARAESTQPGHFAIFQGQGQRLGS
ncbi:unnamed protein product [Durusdinium trenchii]|uniref:Uncharacterized protein n=3 Tax=Durusdinium trenchii TaxID=1381693 RepID=A0ABP0R0A3_9DINO